jgi:hypothetical protein
VVVLQLLGCVPGYQSFTTKVIIYDVLVLCSEKKLQWRDGVDKLCVRDFGAKTP